MNNIIYIAFFLVMAVDYTLAGDKCYMCTSVGGTPSNCVNPDKTTRVSPGYCPYCGKTVTTQSSVTTIVRSCASYCRSGTTSGGYIHCCQGHLCNGASRLHLSLLLGGLATLLGFGLAKL